MKEQFDYPVIRYSERGDEKELDSQKVEFIIAMGNYTKLYLVDGRRVVLYRSLKALSSILPPQLFTRIHRSCLVNRNLVQRRKGEFLKMSFSNKMVSIGGKYKENARTIFLE